MTKLMRTELDGLLQAKDRGWVRLQKATWHKSSVVLLFAIDARRNGPTRETWSVVCKGIREYTITDANGGGLALYEGDHPLVRQHVDEVVSLRFRGKTEQAERILGELLRAHLEATDDWIAFDAYLGDSLSLVTALESGKGSVVTGPKFLLTAYAETLRTHGLKPRVVRDGKKRRGAATALHFGNSYLIAGSIRAERIVSATMKQ